MTEDFKVLPGQKAGTGWQSKAARERTRQQRIKQKTNGGGKRRDECLLLPYCPTRSSFLRCLMEIMDGSVFTLGFASDCTYRPAALIQIGMHRYHFFTERVERERLHFSNILPWSHLWWALVFSGRHLPLRN